MELRVAFGLPDKLLILSFSSLPPTPCQHHNIDLNAIKGLLNVAEYKRICLDHSIIPQELLKMETFQRYLLYVFHNENRRA